MGEAAHAVDRSSRERVRVRIVVRGAVQGVGFRPFVYRCATGLGLAGWVANSSEGLIIEAEGAGRDVECLVDQLRRAPPANAHVDGIEVVEGVRGAAEPTRAMTGGFDIRPSVLLSARTTTMLPDMATCADCLREIFDPHDRRYRYPFTNCTRCGPRYSILERLPYDRCRTSMRAFTLCASCAAEYSNPHDRRFHAEPNACPDCGPQLALWDAAGRTLAQRDAALRTAARSIREGAIVALKGLGGFQLIADARNPRALARLRARKRRPDKPFAVMFVSVRAAQEYCRVSAPEKRLLTAVEAPIVLLRRGARRPSEPALAPQVAPGSPDVGAMLPYSPLHHLLMRELGFPVVATSGNLSGEPLVHDEGVALRRLQGIADLFLVHDRPILRPVDDSVLRVAAGRPMMLRRARGYAPLPLELPMTARDANTVVLGVGGQLKNTVTLALADKACVGPHIGDLETTAARAAFERMLEELPRLHATRVHAVAHDLHPDYVSTQVARRMGVRLIPVQHHLAHLCAGMAEHGLSGPVLGVAWDGTGYGPDGTVWGGEFLRVCLRAPGARYARVAHLRRFRLPGGEWAIREPRRAALGLLFELEGREALARCDLAPLQTFAPAQRRALGTVLERGVNAPWTSSAGRLFDAVAALVGLRQQSSYEGQAATELEWSVDGRAGDECYEFPLIGKPSCSRAGEQEQREGEEAALILDWAPAVRAVLRDLRAGAAVGRIAARFHNGLSAAIVQVARHTGERHVVLAGGCFQNPYLLERTVRRLSAAGFEPHWPQRLPPNDGGLSFGQVAWARRLLQERP